MKKFLAIFLIFFLLFGVSVPAFAQEPNEDWINYLIVQGFISTSESYPHSYFALVPLTDIDVDLEYTVTIDDSGNVTDIIFVNSTSTPTAVEVYIYTDNSWVYRGGSSLPANHEFSLLNYSSFVFNDIYASTNTVYIYGSDEVFTPPPNLEKVTGEALIQFQTLTNQTIMIIVLCGVGCLAFLISLPILRKVLLRFLNK